ncbi:MAG: phenylalanine--tRNA ligase subunit alpha [Candidatus Dasytiphilus stammeri]
MFHINELMSKLNKNLDSIQDMKALETLRVEYLGKKGHIALHMNLLRSLPKEERISAGILLNEVKNNIKEAFKSKQIMLEKTWINTQLIQEKIDISLPGRGVIPGGIHPITSTIELIENYFLGLGFVVVSGPEIEDSYHNFDALNMSDDHPARTEHDTFWFNDNCLLRTQTSGMLIRIMKKYPPPIRIITSGKVYRKDYDKNHTPMFHQLEGLMVDKNISFTHLKNILYDFLLYFFDKNFSLRFRPSYFPFTEPSAEVDIKINKDNGKWIEVLGCGMMHPTVLRNVGIDPDIYSGLAFGMGIERMTMLRYDIIDIRIFYENNLRFLKQF